MQKSRGLPCSEPPARRPDPLTEAELDAILQGLQQRFEWEERADRYTLADLRDHRASTIYRCRGEPSGFPDVVLKVGHRLGPDDPPRLHAELGALEKELAGDARTRARVPGALGWVGSPPSLCMPYLDGVPVFTLLEEPTHPGWSRSGWDPVGLLAECGRALGVYHAASSADGSAPRALDDPELRKAARKMWVSSAVLERAAGAVVMARRFDDIGPHNFLLTASDQLYLLDPPPDPPASPVHRDVARFLYGVDRALVVGPRGGRGDGGRELREAFLRGYSESGPTDVRTPAGRWLIALYEGVGARGTARQQLRGGCVREALRYGRRWVGRLVRVHRRRAPAVV